MADIEKTGDWEGFGQMLAKAASQFQAKIKTATDINGRLLEQKIVQRITSGQVQPPTGAKFKAWKEKHGYSDTTLMMTTDLMNAIHYENKDWSSGFVGLKRSAVGKDGKSLANIGAAMEFGVQGHNIPPRPFITPVIESEGPKISENYQKAIEEIFTK